MAHYKNCLRIIGSRLRNALPVQLNKNDVAFFSVVELYFSIVRLLNFLVNY